MGRVTVAKRDCAAPLALDSRPPLAHAQSVHPRTPGHCTAQAQGRCMEDMRGPRLGRGRRGLSGWMTRDTHPYPALQAPRPGVGNQPQLRQPLATAPRNGRQCPRPSSPSSRPLHAPWQRVVPQAVAMVPLGAGTTLGPPVPPCPGHPTSPRAVGGNVWRNSKLAVASFCRGMIMTLSMTAAIDPRATLTARLPATGGFHGGRAGGTRP